MVFHQHKEGEAAPLTWVCQCQEDIYSKTKMVVFSGDVLEWLYQWNASSELNGVSCYHSNLMWRTVLGICLNFIGPQFWRKVVDIWSIANQITNLPTLLLKQRVDCLELLMARSFACFPFTAPGLCRNTRGFLSAQTELTARDLWWVIRWISSFGLESWTAPHVP